MKFNDLLTDKDGLTKGPFGSAVKKALFVSKAEGDYKVYEQSVVASGDFSSGNYYLEKDYVESKLIRFIIQPGDFLITGAGTLGLLQEVPTGIEPGIINQALIRIRLNRDTIRPTFFKYFFPYWVLPVASRINGDSVIPNLPPVEDLKNIEMSLPSLKEQEQIAAILSSLDDKIANNKRIIEWLEKTARLIFDYWFTQFDFPGENEKPYRSNGGKMVWNEELRRKIPEGWKVSYLGELAPLLRSTVQPSDEVVYEHYSIPAFDDDRYPAFEPGSYIDSGKYSLTENSLLYSKLNPKFKRLWAPLCLSDNLICSSEFLVFEPISEVMRPYVYSVLDSREYYAYMVSKAVSSTGSRSRVDPEVASNFIVAIPGDDILANFGNAINPILSQAKNLQIQIKQLIKLRDWLLPMLMNGQVTVDE